MQTQSRSAFKDLINTLLEIDERWVGPEWNLGAESDICGAHRTLMHILEGALVSQFEANPAHPTFQRIVTPTRKFLGDNADAIYFDAAVSDEFSYVIRGNLQGAVYFSLTLDYLSDDEKSAAGAQAVLNSTDISFENNGEFIIHLGGEPKAANWLPLHKGVKGVTTRHYFENQECAASDRANEPTLTIETIGNKEPALAPTDSSIAAGISRVSQFIRQRTLDMPPMANSEPPPFVSMTPNEFPEPVPPADIGLAASDAHYSMAPYFIGQDEALVITGRWPDCVCASVSLWNRFQQTLDYTSRTVSLNRQQTKLEKDGSFRIVVCQDDPDTYNWIDTEGNSFGLIFWRFFLAQGTVETPKAKVIKLSELHNLENQ